MVSTRATLLVLAPLVSAAACSSDPEASAADTGSTADALAPSDAGHHAASDAHASDGHGESSDGGWVISPSLTGLPAIPSEFDVNTTLGPAWGTGAIPDKYGDGIAEGAFRFICGAGQLSYDDPIVYPGQPGKAHLHQFFGNTTADAFSSFASLRTKGGSTCNWIKDSSGSFLPIAANRSAYWVPALLDGTGNAVQPDYLSVYYKQHTEKNGCRPTGATVPIGTCIDLPNGLRYIFGRDMKDLAGSLDKGYHYRCEAPGTGHYKNLEEVLAICPAGSHIIGWASAPDCWDGKHLDSPNHRDHMAYRAYYPDGTHRCPSTHPYLIPQFELGQAWNVDGLDKSKLHLSSDMGVAGEKRGATYHADWWGAWDADVLKAWQEHCIEKGLSGSGGDLCNGKMLKGASQPEYGWSNPKRLVPVPPKP